MVALWMIRRRQGKPMRIAVNYVVKIVVTDLTIDRTR
jgi:hypothetical protein